MKMLKSFGCSFIFGTDLPKFAHNSIQEQNLQNAGSHLTWPAFLSQHLGYEYACYAIGGIGNLQILDSVLKQIHQDMHNDFFVIGWTWIDRFDYHASQNKPWDTMRPSNDDEVSNFYFRNLHSEYQDKLTSLIYVKTAIDALNQKQIPFIMTYMDDLLFCDKWHTGSAMEYLQQYCRPHMQTFEGMNFLDWSRKNKFAESATWHPLEEAHRVAGDYMIKIVDKQKTSVPVQQVRV